jgi:hypothetical protein
MATLYSPKIVTNGLVLCLDAGNNKSYPSSGTTWNDLSGNNNAGTLVNGPTFNSANGGSIVFDGTNDYISSILSSSLGTQFSISVWFKKNNNNTGNPINFQGSPSFELLVDASNQTNIWDGSNHFYSFTTTVGTWYNMTVVKNSTNFLLYVNNILSPVLNFASSYNNTNANLIIGKHPTLSANYIDGNIARVSIYNRALSESEVLQNYNANKGRFAL